MKIGKGVILFISILLMGSIIFGSGCTDKGDENVNKTNDSRVVKAGDAVKVDYTGKLEDGTVFDTSIEETAKKAEIYNANRTYSPLTFVVSAGQMIKGFDDGVIGMKVGEEKTITIPPEEAYGEYNKSLIQAIPLKQLNLTETPEVGQTLRDIYGNKYKIVAVNDTYVTLDPNHELAGKTLIFDIKLVSIE